MIDGLWIQMSSDKLQQFLSERAKAHADKAVWYKEQANSVEAGRPAEGVTNDPVTSLRQSQRTHEGKATFFTVLAENLIPAETYRLSEANCISLELYSRYF